MRYILYKYILLAQHTVNRKVFILPRVTELLNHKEKQRGCPLLEAKNTVNVYYYYYLH